MSAIRSVNANGVPPLFCPSGGSSECSSSEDGAPGPYSSEHDDSRSLADGGYEADIEIGKLDPLSNFKTKSIIDPLLVLSAVSNSQSQESINMECPEYRRDGELAHPELCIIVVDIVSQLIDNLLSKACECESRENSVEELERVCAGLARAWGAWGGEDAPPLLERLLAARAPATRLLVCTDHALLDLQRAVLELVVCAARRRLSAAELGALLRLFADDHPPLDPLLNAFTQLLAHQRPNAPDHELIFPIPLLIDESPMEDTFGSSFSQQAELQAHRLHLSHLRAGVTSPWSAAAIRCSVDGAGWAPWLQGFAVATWLYLQPPAIDESQEWADELDGEAPQARFAEPLHLFSVGHDSLMFELWIDIATGALCVRLSRPEAHVNRCVSAARSQLALPLRRSTCLALAVRESVQRRRIHMQVTVFIDGRESETMALPVQGILVRKPTPTSVLLGHAGAARTSGELRVGSVRLYRAPVLSVPTALHLAAHGPHQQCQVGCEPPHFPSVVTPELLELDVNWDQVYELPAAALRELHDNLLLTFLAHAPDTINVYPQITPPTNVWSGRGGAAGSERGEAPRSVRCVWTGKARTRRRCGFASALLLLGGPELLLYLFARVVELEGTAEQQAAALGVLLRAAALDARVAAALHAARALSLLLPVLAAPLCRLSARTLQVILDAACSGAVLKVSGSGENETAVLRMDTDAVLLEPRLIKLLFRAWRHLEAVQVSWEEGGHKRSGSAWSLALACVYALLRRGHPRARFNRYQAARVDLLRHLLLTTKERLLNSECGPLEPCASDRLVGVARSLLADSPSAPPSLNDLALLTDFLLLMHQASDTFVTHSRANFYFLLTTDTPETSDFKFLNLIGKRNRTGDSANTSTVGERSSFSGVSNDDVTSDLQLNNLKDIKKNLETESDRTDPDSGVESTKLQKGRIIRKIKDGRRQHPSSTSDNSDPALEESDGLNPEQEIEVNAEKKKDEDIDVKRKVEGEGLDDYVVVSEDGFVADTDDDANVETTYQKESMSGVRAGAEPGWRACEGLLLLLRDALAALPLDQLAQAASVVVQMELVAVLANHPTGSVRAAVLRVARELLRRTPPAPTPTIAHKHFYALLAVQVSLYAASWELAAAAATLLTDHDVPLEDQLDAEVWTGVREEWAGRAAPLLALLPLTVRDVPLAHNLVAILRRLIDKVSIKSLIEVGMVEVVVRTVRAVGLEDDEYEGRQLLLEDLYDLLSRTAAKAVSENHSLQPILEAHHLLRYVECEDGAKSPTGVREAARAAQAAMFMAQLSALDARLRRAAEPPHTLATYLTNVLSSATERSEAAEMRTRRGTVQARAVTFLSERDHDLPSLVERTLFCRLLHTLVDECSNESGGGGRRGSAAGVTLAELFWWAASPCAAARTVQPALLRALYRAPAHVLNHIAPPGKEPTTLRKLAVYLLILVRHAHLEAEHGRETIELAITDWARDWAVRSQAGFTDRFDGDALPAEAERMRCADRTARMVAVQRRRAAVGKAVFSREAWASTLADLAMTATRRAVDVQNAERKAFMEHLRMSQSHAAAAYARWQRLIDCHTHERGVWHNPHTYPAAWQLDDVEGPGRVRVRLRRAHLCIPPKFLKPGFKYKAERALRAGPLRSVLGGGSGAAARLQAGEGVLHTARVRRVCVASDFPGDLLLTDCALHFVPEDGGEARCWPLAALAAVATRRWCLQERALELFLHSGHAHLIAFENATERSAFMRHLARTHLPDKNEQENLAEAMAQWRNGAITNWEYLMILNGLAGRSYNDLMQYPVFPFVIADYTSKILDLTDPTSFRDLSRPMAVQNKSREQHYINTYNDLKVARREGCSPLLSRQPHHYASLYSNSGGVLHYLVRLPPFTELFLNYQDNNFDMPDRTFHSLATTWRLITNDSPTDVKELIPEMFYLPEMFYNNEGLELGVRQCGLRVDDVQLPRWAADARLFTLVHRQALEAPAVTERLPHWIDLVFGYKQTGQAAIDAINVFPACTYYGFDPMALEDELDRTAAAAMVRTYGQAPRQLLRAAHPQRAPDLAPPPSSPSALVYAGATGARWGRYCGSPESPLPTESARRVCPGATRLQPLNKARTVTAAAPQTLLLQLRDEWATTNNGEATESLCALSWGHADGVIRLRRRRDLPPEPLLYLSPSEQVTNACGWSGSGAARGVVGALGLSSGRVLALRSRGGGPPKLSALSLLAHTAPLAALQLCPRAGLLASASVDGLVVLWDLDELTYIRTLPNRGMLGVQCMAISETLSDVCSAHVPPTLAESVDMNNDDDNAYVGSAAPDAYADNTASDAYERDDTYKYKTLLRAHTVNGRFVGSVKVSEGVTCLHYSNGPEGASTNCVAAALRSGGVRLYSSWELRPVTYVPPPSGCAMPLLSVVFSSDSQVLFGCYAGGVVVAWENPDASRGPPPRILPAHSLL